MSNKLLDSYEPIVGREIVDELKLLARRLQGKKVLMVNSTAVGGGVAEILHRAVPMLNQLGILTEWKIIEGDEAFFQTTKTFHNMLQGQKGDLSPENFDHYLEINEMNKEIVEGDYDYVVIHDPQPAALIKYRRGDAKWIWRCHIDLSSPNEQVWDFLRPLVDKYDAAIFSDPSFSRELSIPQYRFYPCIDPLSDKNIDLSQEYIESVFEKFGIPRDKPILTQVSRYDPWKDPVGVIKTFFLVRKHVDCRLLMVGDKAADDPETTAIYRQAEAEARGHGDIHLLFLDPSIPKEINAFQRGSDIVFQKSLREGFALTVSEALWKKRPVIGSAVGGIPAQIIHRETGILVRSIEGAAYWARQLLSDPEFARRLGENGHEHVREDFLITSNLRRWLLLFLSMEYGVDSFYEFSTDE